MTCQTAARQWSLGPEHANVEPKSDSNPSTYESLQPAFNGVVHVIEQRRARDSSVLMAVGASAWFAAAPRRLLVLRGVA
jgi:hypothetical protein